MQKATGFTLIELMIVVAIIAILAAVAYPSYQSYVIRNNRIETQSIMLEIAQKLQSYKLANGDYGRGDRTAAFAENPLINPSIYGQTVSPRSGTALYDLTITDSPRATWLLTATPTMAGRQQGNGAVTLDQAGVQCWYKDQDDATGTCLDWQQK